jgi:UrcA family protein
MFNFIRNSVLVGLALGMALGGVANAQRVANPQPARTEGLLQPPEDSTLTGVTVSVPKVVETTRYGLVLSEATISVRVPYGDLDMKTAAGVTELDARVSRAGNYVCEQLERLYPTGYPEQATCSREAIRGAGPQVIKARSDG